MAIKAKIFAQVPHFQPFFRMHLEYIEPELCLKNNNLAVEKLGKGSFLAKLHGDCESQMKRK